jgi:hypothetical protein
MFGSGSDLALITYRILLIALSFIRNFEDFETLYKRVKSNMFFLYVGFDVGTGSEINAKAGPDSVNNNLGLTTMVETPVNVGTCLFL